MQVTRSTSIFKSFFLEKFIKVTSVRSNINKSELFFSLFLKIIKLFSKTSNSFFIFSEAVEKLRVPLRLTKQVVKQKKDVISWNTTKQATSHQNFRISLWIKKAILLHKKSSFLKRFFNEFCELLLESDKSFSIQKKQENLFLFKIRKKTIRFRW